MLAVGTVWAAHLSETARRRFYKRWYCSKKKAFTKYEAQYQTADGVKAREATLAKMKKNADVVRAIVHTQPNLLKIGTKKAQFLEIQCNGGDAAAQDSFPVDFVTGLFEKTIAVSTIFNESEQCDGVIHRWGVTRLPRKTHRAARTLVLGEPTAQDVRK
eukprot:gene1966-16456_t